MRGVGGEYRDFATGSSKVFVEGALLTCHHCNTSRVCAGELRKRPRNWCWKCNAYICDSPTCNKYCTPIDKLIDFQIKDQETKFLLRGPRGELLFDPAILDKGKAF